MLSLNLSKFFEDINFECEDDELFIDRQLEDKGGLIFIRLLKNEAVPVILDNQQVMLTKTPYGFYEFTLDNLKHALELPFDGVPRFLVEVALNETPIIDNLKKNNLINY